jgi:hypothetical protein
MPAEAGFAVGRNIMISAWTRWRISKAIDSGRPLSPALARAVRRDPECRRFYEASLAMARRLRRDVEGVLRDEQTRLSDVGPLNPSRPVAGRSPAYAGRRRFALSVSAAALAAGLVLGGFVLWRETPPDAKPPLRAEAAEVTELVDILQQLQRSADRVVQRSAPKCRRLLSRSREALRAPVVREAEYIKTDARNFLRAFPSLLHIPKNDGKKA